MCIASLSFCIFFLTEHTNVLIVGFNKSERDFCEGRSSREFNSPFRSFSKQNVSVKEFLPLSDESSDSEWGGLNTNCETPAASSKEEDGWTLVKSKSQKQKSVAESTLYQNQHVLPSIGISQEASSCKETKWGSRENKSNTRHTSGINWTSLPGHSLAAGNGGLQGSNTSTTKRFYFH